MKRNTRLYVFLVLVASLIAVTSCNNAFESWLKLDSTPQQEGFTLSFDTDSNSGRSIRPLLLIDHISAEFFQEGSVVQSFERLSLTGNSFVFTGIQAGTYSLSIVAYDKSNVPIASGIQTIEVSPGTIIYFILSPERTGNGSGSLDVTLSVTNLPVLPSEITYFLTPKEGNRFSLTNPSVFTGAPGSYTIHISQTGISSGDYMLSAAYEYAGKPYNLIPDPVVKIYDSQASVASFSVEALSPIIPPTVLFTNLGDSDEKRVFMTISDSGNENILGLGVGTINFGSVTIVPVNPEGYGDFKIIAGESYKIAAFVDAGNVYSDITKANFYSNINEIVPHLGDPTTYSPYVGIGSTSPVQAGTGPTAITLTAEGMQASTTKVLFVSSSGSGNNSGTRSTDALDFATALVKTNGSDPGPPIPDNFVIYITEDVSYAAETAPSISKGVKIRPLGDQPQTISLEEFYSSRFYISSGGILSLENLVINGNSFERENSGFMVDEGGTLNLHHTTIKNMNNNAYGGAIYLYGTEDLPATFVLGAGSKILNNSASSGGGVYIDSGATMMIDSDDALSQINGNVATNNGGGIYIASGGTLYILSDNYEITGNAADVNANGGGGVHKAVGGTVIDLNNTLSTKCFENTPNNYFKES